MKMDPFYKRKWIKALRSGKYKQGKRYLRKRDHYCCLGVLRELQAPGAVYEGEGDGKLLHAEHAAGLGQNDQSRLADMNDNGVSFESIAVYIRNKF